MTANLASFQRIGLARPDLRAASVAVCVLLQQDVPCLLITTRPIVVHRDCVGDERAKLGIGADNR